MCIDEKKRGHVLEFIHSSVERPGVLELVLLRSKAMSGNLITTSGPRPASNWTWRGVNLVKLGIAITFYFLAKVGVMGWMGCWMGWGRPGDERRRRWDVRGGLRSEMMISPRPHQRIIRIGSCNLLDSFASNNK
jgi:hypothetical protein